MILSHRLRAAAGNASGSFVTDGLMQHFDFSDTNCYASSGATAITDLSGSGNDMTFASAPTLYTSSYGSGGRHIQVPGDYGNGHAYHGSDQSSIGFTQTQGTNPFTIELWFNAESSGGEFPLFQDEMTLIRFSPSILVEYKRFSLVTNVKMRSQGMSGSTNVNSNYPDFDVDTSNRYSSPSLAGWEHFVAVRENTGTNGMKYYRNGTLIKQDINSINYTGATSGFFLSSTMVRLFQAGGGDVKAGIYRRYINKGLTSTEVQQHYDLDKGRFGLS